MSDYGLRRRRDVAAGERGLASMLVVGLNQTIDRTIRLPVLAPGQVLRATEVAVTAGGKAVNVCRAALTLGHAATLVGPFPGRLGRVATDLLAGEGLDVTAVTVDGEIRGTTVVIEAGGRTTVINEPGPPLGPSEWDEIVAAIAAAVVAGSFVAISGSVPPGVDAGAHGTLIELAHARGAGAAVDVTGARLIEAAAAGADLLSPNLAEAEQALAGGEDARPADGEAVDLDDLAAADVAARARAAAGALLSAGARAAIVSAGRHGVACRSDSIDEFVPAPVVDVVNPIGAGDALLGATLVAIERGRPLEAAVRDGVAYAAASVSHPVAGYADPALLAELAVERAR
jgi:1-phosphofructokinase family hexose kinase